MNRARFGWLDHVLLLGLGACYALPLVCLVLASLKPAEQLVADPYSWWPWEWRFENYRDALAAMPYMSYLRNSLVLCLGCVAGTVASSSLAGYAFARLRWRGRDVAFGILISTMLLPWHVTMIPRFLLLRELGLYDSLGALIVPTFCGDAFSIFLLRQFFRGLPEELCEAARLDGCGEWGIFRRIALPLARPALVAVGLFQFVAAWNDFQGPLLYLNDSSRFPLAHGLAQFVSSYSSQTNLLLAASTLFTLPCLALFLVAQRTFLKGISTTGLKG